MPYSGEVAVDSLHFHECYSEHNFYVLYRLAATGICIFVKGAFANALMLDTSLQILE